MVRNIDDLEFCLPSHSDSILAGLQSLRFNPQLSDVTLRVLGREFPCHRAVLALCSQYFHAMFTGNFQESISAHVEIKDVDPDFLETLINFSYTGRLTINQGNVEGLIRISNQLQFPAVRKVCIRYLQQQMDATNCLGIWEFGETHGCPEVTAKAWSFLQENFEAVSQEEEFRLLPPERLLHYLGDPLLQMKEEQSRAQAVLMWVRQDVENRAQYLPELLSMARLSSLTDHYLQELMDAEPLISESETCRALVSRNIGQVTKGHTEQTSVSLQQVLVVVGGKVLEEEDDEDEDDDEPPRTYPNFAFYNPKTKIWMSLPDFPDYNKWGFSITSLNNDVYITGGSRGSRDDSWSTRQGWRFVLNEGIWKLLSPMINPRTNHASASLNGEIYVIGGTLQDAVEVECYDPYSGTWSSVSPAQKYVSNFTAVGCGGKLYLVGSCAIKYNALTLQCYNPSTDSWCVIASPFIPKYLSSPRCCALGGAVYLIADNTKKVYMYLPEVNLWKKVQLLHTLHENGGMTSVGSRIYVTGGHWHGMAREYSVVMESYDSNSDAWSREGALPSRWMYHGTSAIFMDTSRWATVFKGQTQMEV
ncbi:kelch-like protein 30 [Hyla sarda]|uniref:kelch-like protein 30 n=1 Tax=Hyla sarda TaxID=327740 RepID=UPI0024C25041|nr:kelch-like protein 30 [Hyla sarda]XP_056420626.1 kelch-like protein 30 [Hyla sarda]XP_056420627.1 kelch-like protein 30 [Hyla sarda]XP_056420628.1 kelch-like protein 30 [Hyla sarda]XP_056420629.1 kelch-like protein 30 [Hyla sarda]